MTDTKEKNNTSRFEDSLVSELAREVLKEQRRNRRWGIFFKSIFAMYIAIFFAVYVFENFGLSVFGDRKHTALIEISGVISADTEANADFIVGFIIDPDRKRSSKNSIS